MAVGDIVPVPGAQFEETLAAASPDVLREMIREFAQRMMDADVEVRCNAGYGEVTPDRVNSRNGYRRREWDTRAGTIELASRSCGTGRTSRRSWSTAAGPSGRWPRSWRPVYLLGVSTRRVEKLAASLGVVGPVQVAGVRDGGGAGRAGGGVPEPAAGRRAVHVRAGSTR